MWQEVVKEMRFIYEYICVYVCAGETMIQRDVLSTRGGVTPPLHVPIATGNSPAKTATKHI